MCLKMFNVFRTCVNRGTMFEEQAVPLGTNGKDIAISLILQIILFVSATPGGAENQI